MILAMRRTSAKLLAFIPLAIIVAVGWFAVRWWHDPTVTAYRLCDGCGLTTADVDKYIANKREHNLGRAAELELLRATFADPDDAELCEPCAVAIWMRLGFGDRKRRAEGTLIGAL